MSLHGVAETATIFHLKTKANLHFGHLLETRIYDHFDCAKLIYVPLAPSKNTESDFSNPVDHTKTVEAIDTSLEINDNAHLFLGNSYKKSGATTQWRGWDSVKLLVKIIAGIAFILFLVLVIFNILRRKESNSFFALSVIISILLFFIPYLLIGSGVFRRTNKVRANWHLAIGIIPLFLLIGIPAIIHVTGTSYVKYSDQKALNGQVNSIDFDTYVPKDYSGQTRESVPAKISLDSDVGTVVHFSKQQPNGRESKITEYNSTKASSAFGKCGPEASSIHLTADDCHKITTSAQGVDIYNASTGYYSTSDYFLDLGDTRIHFYEPNPLEKGSNHVTKEGMHSKELDNFIKSLIKTPKNKIKFTDCNHKLC